MTITQFIAQLVYVASLEIQFPEFWRYTKARSDLMRALRGMGASP